MPHLNKNPLARKKFGSKKLGLEWTINGLKKPFRKKTEPKNRNSKNQSEIAACEQKKPLAS